MKRLCLPFAFSMLIGFALSGCTEGTGENLSSNNGQFTVAMWNVHNLFDAEETGSEYAEFRESAGWTEEKYAARLLSISQAIIRMKDIAAELGSSIGGQSETPDIIGFAELENVGILNDLAEGHLSKYGYVQSFFGSAAGSALGVGVLSRFPLTKTTVHSITVNNETTPRPVLEVHLEPNGNSLIIFVCHWKSKLGAEEATEALRRASARVINRRILELREEKPGVPVIVMGDLNENHDEFYRINGRFVSALLPDDPNAALLAESTETFGGFLILSNEKPPRTEHFDSSLPVLYTPWENELLQGSYFYRNEWETIDHFLLSEKLFNGQGWDFDSCHVLSGPPFTNSNGVPYSYNPRSGLGLSDHLPLILFLKEGN